jgi:hypothetical protein
MKIIGIISDSRYVGAYIAEVSSNELNAITGQEFRSVQVGTEVRVCETVQRTKDILRVQERIDANASSLRAVADLLGTIQVVIPPVEEVKS